MKVGTLGYVSLSQGETSMIHLTTSTNAPVLHFEFNEACVKSSVDLANDDNVLMKATSN